MGQNLSEEESFWFYLNQSPGRGEKENASKEHCWIRAGLAFMG